MKYRFFSALAMAISFFSMPLLAAQMQPGAPIQGPPQSVGEPAQDPGGYPRGPAPSNQPDSKLTLPAGTLITVRVTELLSSDRNRPGDNFTTVLEQPLVAQGWVVSRRGQTVVGRVAEAQRAGRVQGVSQLVLELNELALVDGQQIPVRTQLVQSSAGTSRVRDAEGVGTATGIGAVIGAAAGGGTGAAIGAAAGAAAGVAGVLSTRGRATEIYPETVLTFRLEEPAVISTEQSQRAFRPVAPEDYGDRGTPRYQPRFYRSADSYPPPAPYIYSPYYYPGYYPPYGYMGYYGFGPSFYYGPRVGVFIGGGHYRRR